MNVVTVNVKGIIDESMTGAVSSLISSSKLFGESKVTIVTTLTRSGEAKVSTRATEQLVQKGVNLGKILQNLSPKYGGIGEDTQSPRERQSRVASWTDSLAISKSRWTRCSHDQ